MRSTPILQQLLYIVLTPIQSLSSTFLTFVCSIITSFTSAVDTLRINIFGNFIPFVATLPFIPVTSVQIYFTLLNETLGNLTAVIPTYGCAATSTADTAAISFFNAIIGAV